VAEVPPGEVTVTSTVPLPAGLGAMISVSLTILKLLADVFPNDTLVALLKPVPVIVTILPPLLNPLAGLIPVTVGVTIGDGDGDGVGVGVEPVTTSVIPTCAFPPFEVI
jgi:hypothetical protein